MKSEELDQNLEALIDDRRFMDADTWKFEGIEFELPLPGRPPRKEIHRQWQRRVFPDILPDSPNADAAEKIPLRFINSLTTARNTERKLKDVLEGDFGALRELFLRRTKGRKEFPIAFHVLPVKSGANIESRAFTERTILMLMRGEDGTLRADLVKRLLSRFRRPLEELDLAQRLLLHQLEPGWDPEQHHTPDVEAQLEGHPPFAADACRLFQRDVRTLLAVDIPSGDFFEYFNSLLAIHLGLYPLRLAYRINPAMRAVEATLSEPDFIRIADVEGHERGQSFESSFHGRLSLFVPPAIGDRQISMTAEPRLSYHETEKVLGELHFNLMLFHRLRELTASYIKSEMGISDASSLFEMTRWPSQIVSRLKTSPRYHRFMQGSLRALVIRFAHDQLNDDRAEKALEKLQNEPNPLSTLRFAYELYNLQPPAKPSKNRAYKQGVLLLNGLLSSGEYGIIQRRPRVGGYFEFGLGLLPLVLLLVVGSRGEKVQLDVFWEGLAEYGFSFDQPDREELLSRLRSMGLYERFSDAGAANYVRSLLIADERTADDPVRPVLLAKQSTPKPKPEPTPRPETASQPESTPEHQRPAVHAVTESPGQPLSVKRPGGNYFSEALDLGDPYSRHDLAELLGYKSGNALNSGVVTPVGKDSILLFVSKKKQSDRRQYEDHISDGKLYWEGQDSRRSDDWIIRHAEEATEVLLFFRRSKNELPDYAFHYLGEVVYESHETSDEGPTRFILQPCNPDLFTPFGTDFETDEWTVEVATIQDDTEESGPEAEPQKICPSCGIEKPVESGFGYRMMGGVRRPQSWCNDCRSGNTPAKPSGTSSPTPQPQPKSADNSSLLEGSIDSLDLEPKMTALLGRLDVDTVAELVDLDIAKTKLSPRGKKAQAIERLRERILSPAEDENPTVSDSTESDDGKSRFRKRLLHTLDKMDLLAMERVVPIAENIDISLHDTAEVIQTLLDAELIWRMPTNYIALARERNALLTQWKNRQGILESIAYDALGDASPWGLFHLALFLERESDLDRVDDILKYLSDAPEVPVALRSEVEELKFARAMERQ